jgi:hypothetical protein
VLRLPLECTSQLAIFQRSCYLRLQANQLPPRPRLALQRCM